MASITPDDIRTLQQLLGKKLKGVPGRLLPPITALDIVNGTVPSKYPFAENDDVAYGATLGGILFHAGTIVEFMKLKSKEPITHSELHTDALLSVFCGNFVKEANFSIEFDQTRLRASVYVNDMLKGRGTPLKQAYIYSCLEAANIHEFMHPASPTFYRVQFIELLKTKQ